MAPKLVPELVCSDVEVSLAFYVQVLGFKPVYERPEERFAYLEREGSELMLEQAGESSLISDTLQKPFGRGVNLQIEVADVEQTYEAVLRAGSSVFRAIEEKWYRKDKELVGSRQFVVKDPDGYLLRFFSDLGTRQPPPRPVE